MKEKQPAVYIVTNKNGKVLYVGATSDLLNRIGQHKQKLHEGFAAKYNCDTLVYYELVGSMAVATQREKQIKEAPRQKKIQLIESINPDWNDLSGSLR